MATTNATAPKAGAPNVKKQAQGFTGIKSGLSVIIACAVVAVCIYLFGFGHVSNFKGADSAGIMFAIQAGPEVTLKPDGLVGTVYEGGFVVPIIWTLFFTVVALCIERFFAIRTARVARSSFYTIGACTAASILVIQTILNCLGTLDILPFTGVTFPFLSNGGTSMIGAWGLLAFVKAGDTRQNASFAVRLNKKGG